MRIRLLTFREFCNAPPFDAKTYDDRRIRGDAAYDAAYRSKKPKQTSPLKYGVLGALIGGAIGYNLGKNSGWDKDPPANVNPPGKIRLRPRG